MPRPRKSILEKCQPCSFSLPPNILDALNKHDNKSQIVATILEENLDRIGDMSILEAENIRRDRIRAIIDEELMSAIERIRERVIDGGVGRLGWTEEMKSTLRENVVKGYVEGEGGD